MAAKTKKATSKSPEKTKRTKVKKSTKPKTEKKAKAKSTKKPKTKKTKKQLGALEAKAAGMKKVGMVSFGGLSFVCRGSRVKNRSGKKIPKVFCTVA